MRVLAIDLGMKRTGMAISDELNIGASILPNLAAKDQKEAVKSIGHLIIENKVTHVLIGLPENENNIKNPVVKRAFSLKEALCSFVDQNNLSAKIILWDETLSSKDAQNNLKQLPIKRSAKKNALDGQSAALMIRQFLSYL